MGISVLRINDGIGQLLTSGHRLRIKIAEICRHVINLPFEEKGETESIGNPGLSFSGRLRKGNRPPDRTGNAEESANALKQKHGISGIPNLLVNIKRLGIHDDDNLHLPGILEEITKAWRESLKAAVVHGDANLIQTEQRMGLWPERLQVFDGDQPDPGNLDIGHIRIDIPAAPEITVHLADHVTGFPSAFLTKNEDALIGILIFEIQENEEKEKRRSQAQNHHSKMLKHTCLASSTI